VLLRRSIHGVDIREGGAETTLLSCLHVYAQRYSPLLSEMRADLQEFRVAGTISRARQLADATDQLFNADRLPQFFTGDLDGPVVLVHLNPKQANAPAQSSGWQTTVRTLEEYFDACRHFGTRMYGPSSPRTRQSPFDHKQIRFLRPLGVIDFVQEHSRADRFTNLERVVDDKLQLELVPYGSVSFSPRGFTPEILAPHLGRILSTIVAAPRRYVLFCGAVFRPLLSEHVIRWHEFHLRKKDGTLERQRVSFANLLLPYEGGYVRAGLAQSWARQGIPMAAYAEEIRSRYEDRAG
jgi:hypothetical protein